MRRSVRAWLLAIVTLLGVGTTAAPSEALQTLAWTFVVDCADPNGSSTGDFGLDMPNGHYAVAVAGACLVDTQKMYAFNVGTPCSLPVVGAIPCIPGVPIANVPGAVCWTHTVGVGVQPCGGAGVFVNGCLYVIAVDGQCVVAGAAGTIYHNPGPMRAHFLDGAYSDNIGYFVVTVTWTPL